MLIDISSATLRKMVKLSERKEALMSQIQELDRQMSALEEPAGAESKSRGSQAAQSPRAERRAQGKNPRRAAGRRSAGDDDSGNVRQAQGKTGESVRLVQRYRPQDQGRQENRSGEVS